ncbi:ribose-phosphate diphosphokinase [Kalamiella sp. sgz302252]|uniref:ribose-phosphate diphosphokinase n=1 Tax=Pantoea sp. sgz302252 TaxID=3341827 RepID=UPI0036D231FB
MKLELFLDGQQTALETGRFPDGAVRARLLPPLLTQAEKLTIRATAMRNMDDLMLLAQVMDAARREYDLRWTTLELPWLPYARQDRNMQQGDSFALKVFAGFLNQLAFDRVRILDPHSDVATAVINNAIAVPQHFCLRQSASLMDKLQNGMMLVAPDAGALKKIHAVVQQVGATEYGILGKHRDLSSGALGGFSLLQGEVAGKDLLIADDLCDAGGTFIGSAAVLRQAGARSVSLYVTHGLFTRGVEALLQQGIDHIWTTTSVADPVIAQDRVELIDIDTIYGNEGTEHAH